MKNFRSVRAAACGISVAAVAWISASPADAQIYPAPAPYYGVGPDQVFSRLESMGLRPISQPHLRGRVWAVRAQGRDGTIVRVLIDAQNGRVVNIVALERPYPPQIATRGPVDEGPWVPMGPGDEDLPPPAGYGPPASYAPPPGYQAPGGYPGPQFSHGPAPEKKVAARPSTPLPKPRPADAQDVRKDQPAAQAAGPKEPETTGSIPASGRKTEGIETGASQVPPINPLE